MGINGAPNGTSNRIFKVFVTNKDKNSRKNWFILSIVKSCRVFDKLCSQSQSHITTDSHSTSPSWCQAPIWDPQPTFLSL
jgi:hypothetical protein